VSAFYLIKEIAALNPLSQPRPVKGLFLVKRFDYVDLTTRQTRAVEL
jgi:hypothetical protein